MSLNELLESPPVCLVQGEDNALQFHVISLANARNLAARFTFSNNQTVKGRIPDLNHLSFTKTSL